MKHQNAIAAIQMPMPSMPTPGNLSRSELIEKVRLGSEVTYHGHVKGGPRFGARGVVRKILGRRVVVDLDTHGTWHVPFYLLAVPLKAA